jgi:hypothetical protein
MCRAEHHCKRNPERTATLLGSLHALSEHYRAPFTAFESAELQTMRSDLEAVACADVIAAAWDRGYSLTPEEVVAFALQAPEDENGLDAAAAGT